MNYEIVEKVTCPLCRVFFGLITSDGHGPIFEDCCGDFETLRSVLPDEVSELVENGHYTEAACELRRYKNKHCTMAHRLAKYQPKEVPAGLAGKGKRVNADDYDANKKAMSDE